nr:hypothetical protein [Tanacetum cinerariifolium]
MRTRSNFYPSNSSATIPRHSNRRRIPNIVEPEIQTIAEIVSMADRTMEELLQAPTEGYGEAIVILEILADNFEIKTNLLQLVQANKFYGFERDNPHTHISNFKRMTATLKYRDVPNDDIKLMFFPYSLEGAARIWYEKEPPNSILTWDDLVNKFANQFFPPSKTTLLQNEISRFTQRFEETFGEAWDRFKEMLIACPHHGFSKLTQIDTLYNGLTEQDQDSVNAASSGNLLNKTTREALKIIENKSKVRYSRSKSNVSRVNTNSRDVVSKADDRIDKLADQISNLVEIVNKQVIDPTKAVEKTCVTCGGAHAYYDCIATDIPNNHIPPSIQNEFSSYMKSNEIMIKSMQNQINVLRGDFNKQEENLRRNLSNDTRSILGSFFQNQPSTSGTLSSNTVPIPKGEMKALTTRSGLAYEGPSIPTESPLEKVDKQNTKEILDKEHSNSSGSTAQVQPPVVPILIPEPDVPRTHTKPIIPYPSRLNDQKLREKATNQMEKFFQIFHDLHFDISFADALLLMPKFASTIKSLLANKDKLLRCHALADLGASINLMPLSIWKKLSLLELTPTRMTFELADTSITHPKGVAEDVFVKVWKFHFLINFVVVDFEADPRVPLILERSFLRTGRALIDVYGEEITRRVNDESVTFNLNQIMRYSDNSVNRVNIINIASEEVVQDKPKSSNPTLVSESDFCEEPIVKSSSPTLTPIGENEVAESSVKNLVPIPSEYEVTSDDESEYNEPINNDSSPAFTTFSNLLFNHKDDFTSNDNESYSNSLFDDDSDEIDSHSLNVESNFVESLSNHDALIDSSPKIDYLEEFSGALFPTIIADEERIRREHAKYVSLMERLIIINPCPRPMENANLIIESIPSSLIPVQDNDSQREEIIIVSKTDELLPPSFENDDDDSEGEIDVVKELLVDNSIPSSENEISDFDYNDPLFSRPPPEPSDVEFDFEPNLGEVNSALMNDNDELECLDPGEEIDVFTNDEDDDYFPFMFVILIFLPYFIYPEVSLLLLFAESEDTIFDPGISVKSRWHLIGMELSCAFMFIPK